MFLRHKLLIWFVVLMILPVMAIAQWQPQEFEAHYQVKRNGKLAGETVSELRQVQPNHYVYSSRTTGTKGMASLAGVKINQKSCFSFIDGQLQSLSFNYKQKIAWKKKKRHAVLDTSSQQISGAYKKSQFSVPYDRAYVDPQLVNLALGQEALSGWSGDKVFQVFDKNAYREWTFSRQEAETISLPQGDFETIVVSKSNPQKNRETRVWLAPRLNFIPVKIQHSEKDSVSESILLSFSSSEQMNNDKPQADCEILTQVE